MKEELARDKPLILHFYTASTCWRHAAPIKMKEELARDKPLSFALLHRLYLLAGDTQRSVTNHLASDISGCAIEIKDIPPSITELINGEADVVLSHLSKKTYGDYVFLDCIAN